MELPSFLHKLVYGKQPPLRMIEIKCAADWLTVPIGLCQVFRKHGPPELWRRTADGAEQVRQPDGPYLLDGKSVSWKEYLSTLPCVQLNFPPAPQKGVQRLSNGSRVIEVGDSGGNLPGQSADVIAWDDKTSGISGKEYARRADINQGLW